MTFPNLVLKFTMTGDQTVHVRGAARIRVDGRGLTLFNAENGSSEIVRLGSVQSLVIQSLPAMDVATALIQ